MRAWLRRRVGWLVVWPDPREYVQVLGGRVGKGWALAACERRG